MTNTTEAKTPEDGTAKTEAVKGRPLTAAEVAKKVGASVRVHAIKKGERVIVERAATAADIMSFAVRDGKIVAITIDGRKHEADA